MLNRTTLPPASLAASGAGLNEQGDLSALGQARRRVLGRMLQLPTTAHGYAVFVACLLILAFTMVLHITLSAEIMRMEVKVSALKQEHSQIEQTNANLVWQIAVNSSLSDVHRRAQTLGYTADIPIKYVVVPADVAASAAAETPIEPPAASAPTDGRVLVLTPPENLGEPQAETVLPEEAAPAGDAAPQAAGIAPETPADGGSRWQRAADDFVLWLREFVPGQYPITP